MRVTNKPKNLGEARFNAAAECPECRGTGTSQGEFCPKCYPKVSTKTGAN